MNIRDNLFYYGLIIPISLLPFPVLYGLSDVLYYVMYYIVAYRKKVVFENIKNSFPEKTERERLEIARKYYRHFCDLTLESLKVFTISENEVRKRMTLRNPEFLDSYFDRKQSILIAGGHYNNWEYCAVAIAASMKHEAYCIYKPFTSHFFDEKMKETRGKYGLKMISAKMVKRNFERGKSKITATIFLIDQSPPFADRCHWMTFLNQDTGVLYGTEKYAIAYNYPVVFFKIIKERRGYYSFEYSKACDDPLLSKPGEITETITKILEKNIIDKPEYWLWSHKRWKHKRPVAAN
jgi:Kdo2-lipid IVA lauroyltransferase/acyltransferase